MPRSAIFGELSLTAKKKKKGARPPTSGFDDLLPFFKLEGIFSLKLLFFLAFFASTVMSSALTPPPDEKALTDDVEEFLAPDGSEPLASRLAERASTGGALTDGACPPTNARKKTVSRGFVLCFLLSSHTKKTFRSLFRVP